MDDVSQYREMFVQEAQEHIQVLNQSLLKLESEPGKQEHLDSAFRAAHTVKGMAATMGYDQIKELCKAIEGAFDKIRKNEEKLTPALTTCLFKCFDSLQEMVEDQTKKIDVGQYLRELQNPSAVSKSAATTESAASISKTHTIRVSMKDLDSLVDLVGELMIAKMRLEQTVVSGNLSHARHALVTLGRLISDLQYQTMKVRLVPVEQIFDRFPRMIRDLSTSQGKEIKLEMEGRDIELDRMILDAITDPLLHILRNAVDHAIELPADRQRAGKPSCGMIRLGASKVSDRVLIQIKDDGKGIDVNRVKAKAVEKKVITKEEADAMSDEDVLNSLIGTPGLSTAKEVTDISGRGVGMDVVFSQVESVGGQVKIETASGQGTTVTLVLPLSLAVIGGLLITVGSEKYVIPISNIISTANIDNADIRLMHGKEVMMLRDQIVPLAKSWDLLGVSRHAEQKEDGKIPVVIINKNGKPYGLIVDSFESKQEIVLKHLDNSMAAASTPSDATILPDGKVALILDTARL